MADTLDVVAISGVAVITICAISALMGSLTVHVYFYHQAFPKDKILTKSLVYATYILALFSFVIFMVSCYSIIGSGWGNISALTRMTLDWMVTPVSGGLMTFLSQMLYAYRIHVLSGGHILPGLVLIFSLATFACAIAVGVLFSESGTVLLSPSVHARLSIPYELWCVWSAICDIFIAACMVYLLNKANTGFHRTNTLVSKLTRLIIETGVLTAIVAGTALVLYVAVPGQFYYVPVISILPFVQGHTVVVLLNSRSNNSCSCNQGLKGVHVSSGGSSDMQFGHAPGGARDTEQPSVVTITREVFSDVGRMTEGTEMKDFPDARTMV
ncbi:hypothetical protein FB45DRAFT_75416 [Roridomyces roridus]|uniref:DUF6534 domain-containing protein n=1 Tax=Roridomyces roridus TaxID=1738132 RepID=A0AAD7FII3_9AGAR|nr:hypothetical protein FB45DRAFT_75416 [Roridomyces roridus]